MCLTPYIIKNPNYGKGDPIGIKYRKDTYFNPYRALRDSTSEYIYVPCGKCAECRSLKQEYIRQRCVMMSLDHYFFFGTLTWKNDMLPYVDYLGERIYYPDARDFALMIKRFRQQGKLPENTKYVLSSEYGGRRHRPHLHFLLAVPKKTFSIPAEEQAYIYDLESRLWRLFFKGWCRNVGSDKFPVYKPLYEYHCKKTARGIRTNFDFHFVEPNYCGDPSNKKTVADVATYVSKYMLKYDKWFGKYVKYLYKLTQSKGTDDDVDNFQRFIRKIKPKVILSKHFGDGETHIAYIRKCIGSCIFQKMSVCKFYNPLDGRPSPMSPYYQKKAMTVVQAFHLYFNLTGQSPDNVDWTKDSYREPDYSVSPQAEVQRKLSIIDHFNDICSTLEILSEDDFTNDFY